MKTSSFCEATMIVTVLNRVTGLKNFSDSGTRFCTLFNYSYKIFLTAFLAWCVYYSELFMILTARFNIKAVVFVIMGFVCFLSYACITLMSWYHFQDFSILKQRIANLEESLTKLGVVVDHRNILVWIIGMNIAAVLSTIIVIGYSVLPVMASYSQEKLLQIFYCQLVYNYILNIGGLVILEFATCVWWLKFGFKQTNDLLKKFLVDGCQINMEELDHDRTEERVFPTHRYLNKWMSKYSTRRTRVVPLDNVPPVKHELQAVKRVQMIQEIRFIHLQLCRITKLISSVFGVQLMVYTLVVVIYLTAILYYLYTMFTDLNSSSDRTRVVIWLFDPLYMWIKIVLVSYVCENAAKEAKKVIVIIHECSVYDIDTELKDEISQFSLQISLSQVGDVKYNLLPLNFSFVRQWIGSMTTYLIIMIQWYQSVHDDDPKLQNKTDLII